MNGSLLLKCSIASMSVLCAAAQANTVTLMASSRGSQSLSGQTSTWFTAGHIDVPFIKEDYRAFAVFDLDKVAGFEICSAVIRLDDFQFSRLPFNIASFEYTLSQAKSIRYADLEGGIEYGSARIDPFAGSRTFKFDVNAAGLADLKRAIGTSSTFNLGMSANGPIPALSWTTFLESFPTGNVSLVLTTADPQPPVLVPLPPAVWAGTALLGGVSLRQITRKNG